MEALSQRKPDVSRDESRSLQYVPGISARWTFLAAATVLALLAGVLDGWSGTEGKPLVDAGAIHDA